jgi:hypothetical protein
MAHGQFNRSTKAYEKYKANLNALFDGKIKMPEHLQMQATPAPMISANPKSTRRLSGTPTFGYDIFMEAIKRSATPDEVTRTINALLESGHQIPQDEEILSKALIHRDESMVVSMLQKLKELLDKQGPKSPRLLKTRLENLLLISPTPDIKVLVKDLQTKLA